MDADRLVATVRRRLVSPDLEIEGRRDWPDRVVFKTNWHFYEAQPADWLIGGAPWVAEAVRLVATDGVGSMARTYGLLFGRSGEEFLLNDVQTVRTLGGRLGDDLDPVAYAEVLAELYSGRDIEGPIVTPVSVSEWARPGELVRDVADVVAKYPFVAPELVAPPAVEVVDDEVRLAFHSCHYRRGGSGGGLDILHWTVTGGGGRPAAWSRRYVVEDLQRP
ncbi:hypothetical protein GCM10027290_68030 [Micromonospora sonneratiae]|uniref:Uncharacterized protein n=1 Tax=Micromonospora sonneratiae TaxID=1184706 RepID=A0ABW3YLD8_9ACTN